MLTKVRESNNLRTKENIDITVFYRPNHRKFFSEINLNYPFLYKKPTNIWASIGIPYLAEDIVQQHNFQRY